MKETQLTKTDFFKQYGHRLVKVLENDTEAGDFQLFCPEECDLAQEYKDKGYEVASVFEIEDGEDIVKLDNDCGSSFHKIGFLILEIGETRFIDKKVEKLSGKPFKSKLKINTVKGITINPNTNLPAFTFLEDDSIVDCRTVKEFK